jgi:hypothetical protein
MLLVDFLGIWEDGQHGLKVRPLRDKYASFERSSESSESFEKLYARIVKRTLALDLGDFIRRIGQLHTLPSI